MLSLEALRLYPPPRAGLGQSQGQRTHYGLSLRHESSSEYETDSYYCEEEDSEAFGDGGPAGLATARPPPVKTVQPAGLAALLRQDSLTRPGAGCAKWVGEDAGRWHGPLASCGLCVSAGTLQQAWVRELSTPCPLSHSFICALQAWRGGALPNCAALS